MPSRFAPALFALLLSGCGSLVVDGDGCPSTPLSEGPRALALTDTRTAGFFGEALHLETTLEGEPTYAVVRFDEGGSARLAADRPELRGTADLAPFADGTHARLRLAEDASYAELLDTSDPLSPTLLSSTFVDAQPVSPVFTATAERLFLCGRTEPDAAPELLAMTPGSATPAVIPSFTCNLYEEQRHAARGDVWLTWNLPTGFYVQDTHAYRLGPESADTSLSYGYNQSGVHMYGNVVDATTNGLRAVFDPQNESQFLLVDGLTEPYADFTWAVLDLPGETHLLGLADTTLYLSTPTGARAYDVTDVHEPALTSWEIAADWEGERPRMLASSEKHLLIVAGERLFLVPRDASGTVTPLVVHEDDGEPLPSCSHG